MHPFWLKLLPASMRQRALNHAGLPRIAGNIGWLMSDRILRMGLGLLVGVWLARYLGPERFGLMNYVIAFVSLFAAVSSLGLNSIVVRDMVNTPDETPAIMGSAFVLMLAGGLLSWMLATLCIPLFRPNDAEAQMMVCILGITLVFKASEVIKYGFEAQVNSKYSVWVENSVFILQSGIKVGMILGGASLIAFIGLSSAEACLVAIGLFYVYTRTGRSPLTWRWNLERAQELLRNSWPLILSSFAVIIYMRIDQIMLGQMLGDESVGHYSAAIRISEAWYFTPMAIAASVAPSLLKTKKDDEALYYLRLQKLFNLMVLISLLVAIPMTFLSDTLITAMFGASYLPAGKILAIHIWTGVFVFLGVASSQWLLAENLQKLAFSRTLIGAIINIALNFVLIPTYGGVGAAIATVVSQACAAYFFDLINPRTRRLFSMKTKALAGNFLNISYFKS